MPPPPPPSKSYLLVFDSDSSDNSEDEYRFQQQHYKTRREIIKPDPHPQVFDVGESDLAEVDKNSPEFGTEQSFDSVTKEPTQLVLSSPPSHEEEAEKEQSSELVEDQNCTNKKLTKNQKKRRSRRKKKKASQKALDEKHGATAENSRRVSFSNVAIRAFPRAFSEDTVPGHGGWPLGMKLDGYNDLDEIPVEDYESDRQNKLCERWKAILSLRDKKTSSPSKSSSPSKRSSPSKKKKETDKVVDEQTIRLVEGNVSLNSCGENGNGNTTPTNTIYESRQWDYRMRLKNPLFFSLSEDERHALFLEASDADSSVTKEGQNYYKGNDGGRTRSNSMGNHNHNLSSISCNTRSRSNSLGNHDIGNSIKDKFNEEYSQAMVHHYRNELEQIRFERNKSGATGCNCRKLVVYLPPKDGSGGKKANHRRLKPSKVVQELKKRHLYDSKVAAMSREQLERYLHKIVEKEPCCRDDNCFCVRNGLNCQADACSCWHNSHVHAKPNNGSNDHTISNDEIKKRCGNPLGMYAVDTEGIDRYRAEKIKQTMLHQQEAIASGELFCQVVQDS